MVDTFDSEKGGHGKWFIMVIEFSWHNNKY
jgi:hypothetical protein